MTGIEFWTIIATGLSVIVTMIIGVWVIWKEVRSFETQMAEHGHQLAEQGRQLNYRVDQQSKRTDQLYNEFQTVLGEQSKRSDRLYEMFIDLLKEQRK